MKFNIGDKVSFLNEKGGGVITNILSDYRVLVTNEDGFEVPVSVNEIVPVTDKSAYKINSKMIDAKETKDIKPPKLSVNEVWEVDLHHHELQDGNKNTSDYEKLNLQLDHFRKCMDAAIAHRIKKIIFIHGVGKGTLKQEIIHALQDYEQVRYFDAPYKKYGFGAIVVEIE